MRFAPCAGLLAVCAAALAIPPECEASNVRPDWSRVESIAAARRVRIVLYSDQAPEGKRKFSGRFVSADPHSVTVALRDGTVRLFQKPQVRKVLVRVPVGKRVPAWVMTGLWGGFTTWLVRAFPDFVLLGGDTHRTTWTERYLRGYAFIFLPGWGISMLALSHKPIYNVPQKHRVP